MKSANTVYGNSHTIYFASNSHDTLSPLMIKIKKKFLNECTKVIFYLLCGFEINVTIISAIVVTSEAPWDICVFKFSSPKTANFGLGKIYKIVKTQEHV